MNLEPARELLGMEPEAFKRKALTDAAFYAACTVIVELDLDRRVLRNKLMEQRENSGY